MGTSKRLSSRYYTLLMMILLITPSIIIEARNDTVNRKEAVINVSVPSPADSARLSYLIKKAYDYLKGGVSGFNTVRSYIDSANTFCEQLKIEIPAELQLLSARYSFETGDYSKAEEQMTIAENSARENRKFTVLARVLLFKGNYHMRTRFFQESREAYETGIEVAKENKIKGIIPAGYFGIANVMHNAGDSKSYKKFLAQMIQAALMESDTLEAEEGLLRLGNAYIDYERSEKKADSLLKKCLVMSLIRRDTFYTGFSSANIGWNFYLDKKYDSARFYYNKSLKYSIPARQYGISANSLGNLGTIYRDLGYPATAIGFYKKSLDIASKINDWYTLSWVNNDLSNLYLGKGDTSNAYLKYVLYKQFSDSLQVRRTDQGLAEARLRYEADNHRKEIDLLSLRLKNNRLLNIGFSFLIGFTILIALLIISVTTINNKRRLSEMNQKISEITQANLRQQMNPHFIFNTLNSIQYYMYQHDKLATNNYLTKFSNLIRKVFENSQHTSIPLNDELDALRLYLELESLRFADKFDYRILVDEEIDPVLYKIPAMLIQPYVENSIGHGLMPLEKRGLLEISVKLGKEHLTCTIEDNGIGREAAIEINRAKGGRHNSLGTHITNSRIDMVNSFYGTDLKVVYTDLVDIDGKAAGTRVEIQIPIMI